MGKAVIFMGVAIIVLLVIISLLIPQLSTAKAKAEDAQILAGTTKQLLKVSGIRCTARTSDIVGIVDCIKPALQKDDFFVDSFRAFNERTNETGVFIIENKVVKTYNGTQFILLKNSVEVARGCHISSEILQGYTCRFALEEACEEGDVFDVVYDETSMAKRTC